jgi:hypothetical protein
MKHPAIGIEFDADGKFGKGLIDGTAPNQR